MPSMRPSLSHRATFPIPTSTETLTDQPVAMGNVDVSRQAVDLDSAFETLDHHISAIEIGFEIQLARNPQGHLRPDALGSGGGGSFEQNIQAGAPAPGNEVETLGPVPGKRLHFLEYRRA